MSASFSDPNRCEPNLVPILDMVFQLITFFMLVVNFKTSEVDRDLTLPIVGSTRPVEEESNSEVLVLNLRANGDLFVRGAMQPAPEVFIPIEARTIYAIRGLKRGEPLPVRAVIRGDKSIRVERLLGVIDLCRANGFEKFDFIATQTKAK